jgi:hypothetical protein
MPAPKFSVPVDRDELATSDLSAGLTRAAVPRPGDRVTHHGARDDRQAARRRSGRDHATRAAGAGGGRSYAFRRS